MARAVVLTVMNTNPLKHGLVARNSTGIGTVNLEMVEERAAEIALINGHSAGEASKFDLEQAQRELTGSCDLDPEEEFLASIPETDRWSPTYGSTGHMTWAVPDEDVDEDGRSNSARLVEEGIAEAEHDQMLQAAREQQAADKS